MSSKILLCSDLDRTIIPNGPAPESPHARPLLHTLARRPEVTLAYVSGRGRKLLQQAISEYDLPLPDYAVGDVGASIYQPASQWQQCEDWQREIAGDWHGKTYQDLKQLLADVDQLQLQEPQQQNTYKLSYYTTITNDRHALLDSVRRQLESENLQISLIWSIDEQKQIGLLDILPANASKLHAIRFIMRQGDFSESNTVFAGDSGNDFDALTSGLQAVLVKNAREQLRQDAQQSVAQKGHPDRLYLAQGGFLGMNGNYAAGVLEGVAYFLPEVNEWLAQE